MTPTRSTYSSPWRCLCSQLGGAQPDRNPNRVESVFKFLPIISRDGERIITIQRGNAESCNLLAHKQKNFIQGGSHPHSAKPLCHEEREIIRNWRGGHDDAVASRHTYQYRSRTTGSQRLTSPPLGRPPRHVLLVHHLGIIRNLKCCLGEKKTTIQYICLQRVCCSHYCCPY